MICPFERSRGRRECRMLAAPVALRAKKAAPLCTQATTGQPTQPALPAQWATAYTRSPRCAGLSGHRPLKLLGSRVDPSIGGSGPHDLAVRAGRARLAQPSRPPHPAPNVRDDREAPLYRARDARKMMLIWGLEQCRSAAADWHDGQFAHNTHAQFSLCRANQFAPILAAPRITSN